MRPFLIIMLLTSPAWADAPPLPAHLQLARQLLAEVSPEHNSYQHHGWVRWQGDAGLLGRAEYSAVQTDCSGLLDAIFQRTDSLVLDGVRRTYWKEYPKAENYYAAIASGQGFVRREHMQDVEAGDVFAARYLHAKDTGHVMIVNSKPQVLNPPQPPLQPGTTQWLVEVIDSAGAHWKGDTRYREDGSKQTGIGRGLVRIYTREDGSLAGWAWSAGPASKFRDDDQLAIGQPLYPQ